MMDTIDRFIKQIFSLDVEAKEYILTVAGWLPRSSYPGAPYTRKDYRWQLNRVDEREMLVLHDAAVDHVAILPKESINNLNRIHEQRANRFTSFFDFIKGLYVKVSDGLHTGLDISDFEQKIEGRFNVKLPERGAINISFLDDLLDELTFKSGLFDGFREAVGLLLDNSAKAKDKTEAEQLFEEVDGRGKDNKQIKTTTTPNNGSNNETPDFWIHIKNDVRDNTALREFVGQHVKEKKGVQLVHLIFALRELDLLENDPEATGMQTAIFQSLEALGAIGAYATYSDALSTQKNNSRAKPKIDSLKERIKKKLPS